MRVVSVDDCRAARLLLSWIFFGPVRVFLNELIDKELRGALEAHKNVFSYGWKVYGESGWLYVNEAGNR